MVITIDVDVPADYRPATFTNSATVVSAATADPDQGDNTGTVSGDAAAQSDLSVSTTPVSETAVPGTEVTWQVLVRNAGPATAREVTLTELLPDGVTLVSLSGDDVVCDLDTGVCTLGDLAPGATRALTVVAAVDEDYQAPTVTSTVSVTSSTPDPVPADNTASSTLTTVASADVSVVKTVDPGTLSPGEPATFTLTVANAGPSVARDVTVTDPVDPALTVSGTEGADCEIGGTGTVSCDLGDLVPDADPVVITIDVDVPADYAAGTFANTALVASTTADPDTDDNTGSVSGPAAPLADLSVTKTPVSGTAVPGSQVSWTVVVRNDGPATARAVTLSEVLPQGVDLVSLTGDDAVCDTATGLCTLGDLAPGQERTLTVVATVPAGFDQPTLTATAGAAAATADPDDTDNVASSTIPVSASADLSLVKTVDPGTLSPGESATFTLTVDNAGPSVAREVTVSDPIDPALTVTAVSGADCETAQTVTCSLGDLAPDTDPVVITVQVDVPADYEPAGFANSATVSATTPDPSAGNNTGTVTGDAVATADLSVTNTPVSEEAVPGTEATWTVVVSNDGPALARGVTLTDVVPSGVTLVSLTGAGVSCDVATGVCTLGDLAPGASRTITVVAAVAPDYTSPSVTSTATVASATLDPDDSDDVAVSTLPASPRADLVVSNTAVDAAAVPGTESTWTVVVRNDGPSVARGVTAQDVLPAGVTLVSLTGDGVTCDTATGRCTLGDLAPGASRTLTVVAAVPADYDRSTVTSTVTVDATTVDPDPADNVGSSVLPVAPLADLSLVKTVDPGTLSPGEPATFTLTVDNAGPSVARAVTVTDPVDPALEVTAATGADCEISETGTVSCDLGDLAPDAEPVVITIDVDVPPGYAADTFANNAVVSSPTEDPDTADNTGTVSGDAAPLADLSVTNTPVSGEATPGTEVTWTVLVRNDGPATARGVSLTKALPAGVTLVSVTGDDTDCDLATATCALGDLAPGQTLILTMVAAVADDYDQPTVTSTASLASATTDPDTTDNVAPSTLGATGSADLSLVKTVDPEVLSPGEPATFTLTVDNAGPSVARQVTVTDPVDPALTVTGVSGADCEIGQTVTCDLGDLAPDAEPVVITIDVDVPADYAADTFTNNAVVGSATPDPVATDNTGTVSGPAAAQADLSVNNVPGPGPAVPGGQVSWTVVVTNDGPALARNATLTDLLPAGVTLVSLTGDDVVCDTGTGVCSLGDLAPGEGRTLTVVAEIDPGFDEPTLTSTATVTASTTDPDTADNVASSTLVVTGAADLSLVKTVDPDVLSPGEPATFTLTVENAGPSVARDVRVTDEVDAELVVTGTDGADCTVTGGTVDCYLGDLAPDADPVVITIDVDVPETFQPATFTNSATVASTTPDPDAGDNTGTVSGDSVPRADVSVSTTPVTGTAVPGTEVSWQVVVSNAGPATARGVTLTELLPEGVTLVSLSGDDVVCDLDTGVCTLGELAPGASRTLTVVAAVGAGYDAPTVTSTATVDATTLDPDAGNDVSVSTLTTAASADVSLVKTVDPDVLSPGEPATFTLTVENAGPSVARDVTVTDPVDPALEVTAVDGADCEVGGTSTVSCALGDLAPDADPVVITIDVDVPPGYADGTFANTALVTSTTPDPDQGDNTGSVSGPAAPSADLSVTQTPVTGAAVPGSQVSWTVVVRNDGPATARAVTLSEVLPEGVNLVSLTGDGVVCDTATGLCTLGDLAPGEERTLTVVATVPAGYDQPTLTATAGAAAATADPDDTDNVASSTIPVSASADLSLVKTVDPGTLSPGEPATFTLTVDNAGPSVARDVRVIDPVDPALAVTAVSGADCELGQTVTCDLGDLAPDADPVVITIDVDVPASYQPAGFTNSATVSATTPDPSAADNTGTVSGPAAPRADLSVTNAPDSQVVVPGTEISWTVVVRNDGPAVARGVTVTDLLPAGVTLVSLSGDGLECDPVTGTCTVGELAPGQFLTLTVVAAVPADYAAPTLTSTASVTGTTLDPDDSDNVASSTLPVVGQADLALVKTVEPGTLSPGEPATFVLAVTNAGPSVARGVTVTDPVDPELTVTAVTGADCTTTEGGVVGCDLGDLAPGAEPVVVRVVVDVPADYASDTFTNTATVSSATDDPDVSDDEGTVSGDAVARADLALTKTAVGPLTAGTQGSWRLTVLNEGPAVARDVSVTDVLPAGATPVATEGCAPVGSTVTCSVPELAPGASVTWTVTADLASDLDGTLTNSATVGSATAETDPADDTATTTDPVGRVSDLQLSKTVDTENARQGDVVTWTVVVSNDGPSDADAVVVEDDWPEGAQLLDAEADQGEFDPGTGLWSVGGLTVGASATLTLEARLTGTGEVVNTASVTSASVDLDPSGDVASASVSAEPAEPPVDPTEPPVDPTEPPVDPTEPPVDPTEPPVDPTEPPVDPTEPPVDPTEPPVDPTEPPVDPTEPPVDPTQQPVDPGVPPTAPDQPADPSGPRDPLATTGGPPVLLALLGLVTVLAGAGSVANGLRRRR
ncbi:DUF11 domain-containing protein [Auraticoccus monumenti]|uniref:Conserved repeat domain-containing protein n=1 Tax=Auraticoccus monumenti TaxID=675864 RepID=A0A1G7EBE6_9ACTN|nr:DUF11 domain-containing protein [Auraticoccus monumenti]SDE61044.1 conserved repeat domain-containing protein [Auraticoccus monumenti]